VPVCCAGVQLLDAERAPEALVTATPSTVYCLTCTETHLCQHVHNTRHALGFESRRRRHTIADMRSYQDILHANLADDGMTLKLRGRSRTVIDLASQLSLKAMAEAYSTTSGAQQVFDGLCLDDHEAAQSADEIEDPEYANSMNPPEVHEWREGTGRAGLAMARRFR
jgi:phage terminase large subunit-like protein